MQPQKSAKNFIIRSYLQGLKEEPPFYFQTNDAFFPKEEPKIKALLENKDITVLVAYVYDGITPYGGPFELATDKPILGWLIVEPPNIFHAMFIKPAFRHKGEGRRLILLGYNHLDKPKICELRTPKKSLFRTLRAVLKPQAQIRYKAAQ